MGNKKEKTRAICAGCKYFTITSGSHQYSCKLWGVSSTNYNVAQVVYLSTGEVCPYCDAEPKIEEKKKEVVKITHDGEIDIKI